MEPMDSPKNIDFLQTVLYSNSGQTFTSLLCNTLQILDQRGQLFGYNPFRLLCTSCMEQLNKHLIFLVGNIEFNLFGHPTVLTEKGSVSLMTL